jgi:hypothetical protein
LIDQLKALLIGSFRLAELSESISSLDPPGPSDLIELHALYLFISCELSAVHCPSRFPELSFG